MSISKVIMSSCVLPHQPSRRDPCKAKGKGGRIPAAGEETAIRNQTVTKTPHLVPCKNMSLINREESIHCFIHPSKEGKSTCHHVIMSSCHHVIMSSCHHVIPM